MNYKKKKKYINIGNEIDIALLEIYIIEKISLIKIYDIKYLKWLFKYLNKDDKIDIKYRNDKKNISIYNIIEYIDNILDNMNEEIKDTYISIIKEEFEYDIKFNLGCPTNNLHIVLYNLIPFIDYKNTFILSWVVIMEFKYTITNILNKNISFKNFKHDLKKNIYETYVNSNILSKGYIKILLYQLFNKINI